MSEFNTKSKQSRMAGNLVDKLLTIKTPLTLQATQVLTAGVALSVSLLAAASMLPQARGELAFWLQIGYVLTTACLLGLERPFAAAGPRSASTAARDLVQLVRPGLLACAALAVCGIVALATNRTEAAFLLLLGTAFVLGNLFVRLLRTRFITSATTRQYVLTTVTCQLILLSVAVLLYALHISDPKMWLAAYAATSLPYCAIIFTSSFSGKVSAKSELKAIRRSGLKLFPASFGNTAMLRSDRLLLPVLASPAELGIYIVVASVMELASWPIQNWVDASLGKWRSRVINRKAQIRILLWSFFIAALLASILALTTAGIILWFLPDQYSPALTLIAPLGIASVIYSVSRIQQGLLIARNQNGRVTVTETIGMAASVGFYVILIPLYGGIGAAIGSLIGYSACVVVAGRFLRSSHHAE